MLSIILFVLGAVHASADASTDSSLECQKQVEMGTAFKICLVIRASEQINAKIDIQRSFRMLREIDGWMSEWRPGTQLSQVNAKAGAQPVRVRDELFEVLKYALVVAKASDGAFEPTFNAFWGLYNFKDGQQKQPTDKEVKSRLPLVNYKNVVLDDSNKTVFLKRPGMKLGLGGLGQGYGVDRVVEFLKSQGYTGGYVDGSGDTYFWGKKPNNSLWTVGIRDPRSNNKVVGRIYGTNFAITTCGDDEKFFIENGRRIHHIIDPQTGRSANRMRQATVVSKTALAADAFDTASFVMGPHKAKQLLESQSLEGFFITKDQVFHTAGLKTKMTQWGKVYVLPEGLR